MLRKQGKTIIGQICKTVRQIIRTIARFGRYLFFLFQNVFGFIIQFIGPALSQVMALIFLGAAFILEVVSGKRFRRSPRVKSEDQFPYTELTAGFSDSGSAILVISGAKPLDAAIFVYADFYPYYGKKTFLPQTRLFTALNRGETYATRIPWQLFNGSALWSVNRLDIQIGNDTLFDGTLRTPAVMRLASKCIEFLF